MRAQMQLKIKIYKKNFLLITRIWAKTEPNGNNKTDILKFVYIYFHKKNILVTNQYYVFFITYT